MYVKNSKKNTIHQGDVFQKFKFIRWIEELDTELRTSEITIPYFVVLTQGCDLEQDFSDRAKTEQDTRDKLIDSVLVCPAYIAAEVKEGQHLKHDKIIKQKLFSRLWDPIIKNNNPRYHYLKADTNLQIPALIIDFKQYYTIPTSVVYDKYSNHYLCSLPDLYREDVSQRFAAYLSRIGLPTIPVEKTSAELSDNTAA